MCKCDGEMGRQSRNRTCIDLFPNDEDTECFGEPEETQDCELDCTGEKRYFAYEVLQNKYKYIFSHMCTNVYYHLIK